MSNTEVTEGNDIWFVARVLRPDNVVLARDAIDTTGSPNANAFQVRVFDISKDSLGTGTNGREVHSEDIDSSSLTSILLIATATAALTNDGYWDGLDDTGYNFRYQAHLRQQQVRGRPQVHGRVRVRDDQLRHHPLGAIVLCEEHAERMSEPTEVVHEYTPYGAAREPLSLQPNELLLEGPAGTGKTRALLEWVNYLCEKYAGIRVLMLRQTRESLTESVLVEWESEVLWPGHPAIHGSSSRNTRQNYHYPNGSHVVVGGLDKPAKTFSTQYDVIVVFEAREITADTWEWLARANRNFKMPWQMRVADTNPAGEFHWLNTHFPQGFRKVPDRHKRDKRLRMLSRHEDNPSYFDHKKGTWTKNGEAYVLGILAKLTGGSARQPVRGQVGERRRDHLRGLGPGSPHDRRRGHARAQVVLWRLR